MVEEPPKDFATIKREISGSVAQFKQDMELIIGGEDSSSIENNSLPNLNELSKLGVSVSKRSSTKEMIT